MPPLKVLILEDNPSDVELMLHELRKEGFKPDWDRVDSEEQYLDMLSPDYDIILSDYSMPQFNAPRALEILQEQTFSLPFLVVTGSVGEETAVQMIKQGADDYLLKDRLTRLGPAVTKSLREHEVSQQARQAQQALIASEARYRTIFENTGTATIIIEEDMIISLANTEFTRMTGYSKDEVEGEMIFPEFVHPDDTEKMKRFHRDRRRKGSYVPKQYSFKFITKDGETRHGYITVGLIGGLGQSVASFVDVTDRVKAQQVLEASEERYRSIFNGVMDAVLVESPRGEILDVNQKACDIFGYSRADFLTKRVRDLVPEEYHEQVPSADNPYLEIHSELIESVNLRASGETFPVEFSMQRQIMDEKEVLLVVLRDISERKQREKKLQMQLKETSALHHIATISTLETSEDVIIEETTQAIEDILDPDFFGVLLIDPADRMIKVHPSYRNLPPEYRKAAFPVDQGITGQVVQSGQSIYLPDVREHDQFMEVIPGIRSELCVPIKIKENVLGVINIEARQPDAFTEDDERLLNTLAGQLAISIQRARLFNTVEEQVSRLQTLRSIDRTISSSLDINVTLNILLDHATSQLDVDAACILLLESSSKTLYFKAEKGFQTNALQHTHLLIGKGYAGQAVVRNQPVHIPDLTAEPGDFKNTRLLADEGFRFYYALPLNFKGKIQGVLELFHRSPKKINQDWIHFAETLAGQAAIAIDNAEMFEELQSANLELSRAYDSTLEGWARALEMRDQETEGHSKRVVKLTLQLAQELGLPEKRMIHIRRGALLHDIGKIAVPDQILLKPEKLTDQEWEEIRRHPQYAREMLSPISYLKKALDIPVYHHERWDGSGYPEGLEGNQIPYPARIFAVVDVWEALRRDRPYRDAWPEKKALKYIKKNSGVLFDPRVVEAFLNVISNRNNPRT